MDSALPAATAPLTKYRVPRARRDAIQRAALLAALRASVTGNPLTAIVAPAGYGKTTLLTQLAAALAREAQVAWIAVDDQDDDPNRFFAQLVHALEPLGLSFEEEPAALIATVMAANRQARAAVGALVNALCTSPAARIVLVVDDLHRVLHPEIGTLLEALIERLPEHVSMVLAGRTLPPLPLARWAVRGEAREFGPDELQFTAVDAAALASARATAAGDVEALVRRVHGWPAGVSLLLRTAGLADGAPASRLDSEQQLYDYLAEEVLAQLPADLQRFVIDSAVLAELRPASCEAVTGRSGARALLRALVARDLFVTVVDRDAPVLRFHDLFRDFLLQRLQAEPERLRELHARAARAETELGRALGHHVAAGDATGALALLTERADTLLAEGGHGAVERWLERIPAATAARDPRWHHLRGVCAWRRREWLVARDALRRALELADDATSPQLRVRTLLYLMGSLNGLGERELARGISAEIAALPLDPAEQAVYAVQRAWLDLSRGASPAAAAALGVAAGLARRDPVRIAPQLADRPLTSFIGIPGALAAYDGLLHAWELARGAGIAPWHAVPAVVDGWVALWLGDAARGRAAIERARAVIQRFGGIVAVEEGLARLEGMNAALHGDAALVARICGAMLERFARPEMAQMRAAFESVYVHGFARAAWAAGDRATLRALLPRATRPPQTEELAQVGMAGRIVRGQVALQDGDWDAAAACFESVLPAHAAQRFPQAHGDPRVGLAHAWVRQGRRSDATALLGGVLDDCLAEDAIGPLLWEPAWVVRPLLELVPATGRPAATLAPLLARLGDWHARTAAAADDARSRNDAVAPAAGPLATLSERERQVLEGVADGASNKEIARDLDLSLHTVKRHIANILGKLDCVSRRQAAELLKRGAAPARG